MRIIPAHFSQRSMTAKATHRQLQPPHHQQQAVVLLRNLELPASLIRQVAIGESASVVAAAHTNPAMLTWRDQNGLTLLHHAMRTDSILADKLIGMGADVNVQTI